ncbi:MAG: hypothetical protein ACLFN8_04735 [Candidatus Woesearchaeota archaeon]
MINTTEIIIIIATALFLFGKPLIEHIIKKRKENKNKQTKTKIKQA